MCGIAGIVRITPRGEAARGIPDEWLDILDASIAWRGPDDHGRFRDTAVTDDGLSVEVALVHRRLAIIDPAWGRQPMSSTLDADPDDHLCVVFNGCLYNHADLRERLEACGHAFLTDHSDTEVLLHLYRHRRALVPSRRAAAPDRTERGDDALDDLARTVSALHGMYAFAVWDRRMARLVLARDPHGEKPLWITRRRGGVIAFASTIAALSSLHDALGWEDVQEPGDGALGAVGRDPTGQKPGRRARVGGEESAPRLDTPSCIDWLALGWSSQHAPHRGIAPVAPGEELVIEPESAEPRTPLRNLALAVLILPIALPVLVIAATLLVAVGAVVWLGAALPYLLILLLPLPAGFVLRAFGRPSPRRLVQREIELIDTVEGLIDEGVREMLEADVPLGLFLSGGIDSSLVSLHACRHAGRLPAFCVRMPDEAYDESSYARVAAEVAGADLHVIDPPEDLLSDLEALIGLIGAPFADSSLLPAWWLCRGAGEHIRVALSGDGGDELFLGYERQRIAPMLRWASPLIAMLPVRAFDRSDPRSRSSKIARLIEASRGAGYVDLVAHFPTGERRRLLRGAWRGALASGTDPILGERFDLRHYLPGDLLLKTDTAGMAAHIEVRAPLLHRSVSEFALALPRKDAMLRNERKGLLRALARRRFPEELVDRPKMGFAIPVGRWFREDRSGMRSALLDAVGSASAFGSAGEALDIDLARVRAMIEEHQSGQRDHGPRLFGLLTLAIWGQDEAARVRAAAPRGVMTHKNRG
ncbi:MAG: asparagine synthetase B family protein [Phycisphaerales bacterium]